MNPCEWNRRTTPQKTYRRAAGRRRYNAKRRRRAEARREAIAEAIADLGAAVFLARGLGKALADAFSVHPSTISRDLRLILLGGREYNIHGPDGELLFSVTKAHSGGRVLRVEDADGNEIHGKPRREILKLLPRYLG